MTPIFQSVRFQKSSLRCLRSLALTTAIVGLFALSAPAQISLLTLEAESDSTEMGPAENDLHSWLFRNVDTSTIDHTVGCIESNDTKMSCSENCQDKSCECQSTVGWVGWESEIPNIAPVAREFDLEIEGADKVRDYALMLKLALNGRDLESKEARQAITSCMLLVAKSAQQQARTELAQKELEHEKEMAVLRGQLLQQQAQATTLDQLRRWLSPLYSNQNRAIKQIELLGFNSNSLNRTLNLLEKQMSNRSNRPSTPVMFSNPHVAQDDSQSDVYDLRSQVKRLKQELEKLRSQSVQPAQHLQPIFENKQLDPIDFPWPSQTPGQSSQFRR